MRPVKKAISTRDIFVLILFVAMLSTLFTYHFGSYTYDVVQDQGQGHLEVLFQEFKGDRNDFGRQDDRVLALGRSLHMHKSGTNGERTAQSILSSLLKVEDDMLLRTRTQRTVVAGQLETLQSENPFILPALRKHGHTVIPVQGIQKAGTVLQINSSLILCTGNECDHMVSKETNLFQRMDRIPDLERHVTNQEELCTIARDQTPKTEKKSSQPCYNLPQDSSAFHENTAMSPWQPYIVWRRQQPALMKFVNVTKNAKNSFDTKFPVVAWRLPLEPLELQGGPLLSLQVLVTSFLPLRVYIYPLVTSAPYPTDRTKGQVIASSLDETLEYISETYGLGSSTRWWTSVQVLLLRYLTRIEAVLVDALGREPQNTYGCARCYQSFELDVVCGSARSCVIVQIKNQGAAHRDALHIRQMTEGITTMMVSTATVAMDVAQALEGIKSDSFESKECAEDPASCLTTRDLVYLLDERHESLHIGNFVKIYPTSDSFKFTPLLSSLHMVANGNRIRPILSNGDVKESQPIRSTAAIHFLLMALEKFYSKLEIDQPDIVDLSMDVEETGRNEVVTRSKTLYTGTYNITTDKYKRTFCSKDPKDVGAIIGIYSEPNLLINRVTQQKFQMNVDYDVILVKLWAHAKSCDNEARIDDKYGTASPSNQMLGLGNNKVTIYVVDTTFTDVTVVKLYILNIYRQERARSDASFSVVLNFHVCGLKQDCSLPFLRNETCGLQRITSFPVWSEYKKVKLPVCQNGDKQGQWLVPCSDCKFDHNCYWDQARWQPNDCQYRHLSTVRLKKCFAGKRLLFVGDSTNRGILNYIIERLNGSLTDWDKTHGMKTYTNFNDNQTSMTFAYYPHFWLPVNHRPRFNKIIYQLIKRSLPLENNANTVLVIGGVHWLAKQHIEMTMSALRREGLSNSTKIAKGLGAGFHQQMEGMRYVKKAEHTQLMTREREIFEVAKLNNFKVVSTFNMTMARYRDFMQGRCGCHFHRVTKLDGVNKGDYHVEGEINTAYSEIVLNQICDMR